MIPSISAALFDAIELDTNILTPQIHLVAQVQTVATYTGLITNADGSTKGFTLSVVPSSAEKAILIDVSATWSVNPTFTVIESGYVSVSVLTGGGGQKIKISNDQGILLDNTSLRSGQVVALVILRPGNHVLTDTTGGATCAVTVTYPSTPLPTGVVPVKLSFAPASVQTVMAPAAISVAPPQPVVITVLDGTRLTTTLQATTDRVNGELLTKAVVRTR